jgi:hypothetical protein
VERDGEGESLVHYRPESPGIDRTRRVLSHGGPLFAGLRDQAGSVNISKNNGPQSRFTTSIQ